MGFVHKLPLILAFLMTIIIGISGLASGADNSSTYVRMLGSLGLFFITGLIIRKVLTDFIKGLEEKNQKAEAEDSADEEDIEENIEAKEKKEAV